MGRRRGVMWALIFVAILVNLPIGHHYWSEWRLHRSGVDTTAAVVRTDILKKETDPHYVVQFRYPDDVDPEQTVWPVEVDEATYAAARSAEEIDVRVLPGHPATYDVEGQRTSPVGWIVLLVIDAMLVLLTVLLWRARRLTRWDDDRDDREPDARGTADE